MKKELLMDLISLLVNSDEVASTKKQSSIFKDAIGKYVLVRSRNEGLNAGTVLEADETGIVLKDARRIWYHRPADKSQSWYEGVSNSGLSSDSKISSPVSKKIIIEDYSITECTKEAILSIKGFKSNEQS